MEIIKESETNLSHVIKQLIREKGKITFRDFMDMALYYPSLGYYTSTGEKIGWSGDFYTSPDVHKTFAVTVMKQLYEMSSFAKGDLAPTIVEVGAGKGKLCADILESSKERFSSFFRSLKYVIAEKSKEMIASQKTLLHERGLIHKVSWVADPFSEYIDFALIFSNELMDAFPVHKVIFDGEEWREIYVTLKDDSFVEISSNLSTPRLGNFLAGLKGPFENGYTTEVNLTAGEWIKSAGNSIGSGFIMTIDYGYPRADYYCDKRCEGTLLCYNKHKSNSDPYKLIGKQDITAHIDFTTLAEAGDEVGLKVVGYCEQFHFLMGLGVFDELKDGVEQESFDLNSFQENLAIKKLLMPESMGGVFKVLIQSKGIENPSLGAFSFKNLSNRLFTS